ncbi:Transposable element Tcb2 transposase-like Protein [Tribolium castaneum]|uniref:Transposable element Tcb2 transposase-like Protein n=1 Tax=Tribolium castaneum TaxID=7070 RepID=D6WBY3_TRICA|nr:Transposable element Tcb2 transposase-like Protein [Tribolium castaneum]
MLQNELLTARNVQISTQTVRNRQREDDLRARVAAKGPLLNREHRVAILQFAREYAHWDLNDWNNVMFLDESRFCLNTSDRRVPVYSRPGETIRSVTFAHKFLSVEVQLLFEEESLSEDTQIAHNAKFDARHLLQAIIRTNVIDSSKQLIKGYSDSIPLLHKQFPNWNGKELFDVKILED